MRASPHVSRLLDPSHARLAADRAFAERRERTIARLQRLGIPEGAARQWMAAWDATTTGLGDFRRASDFWEVGFQYARAEFKAGYLPPKVGSEDRPEPRVVAPRDESQIGA